MEENQPPSILAADLYPMDPTADDAIGVAVEALDPERDAVEIEVDWYRNGVLHEEGGETELAPGVFARDDEVWAVVFVRDANGEASAETNHVIIANRPPHVVKMELLPQVASATDNLMVVAKARDPEGDDVELGYRWWKNGELLDKVQGSVLAAGSFRRGDEIRVEVIPTDGQDEGYAVSSGTLQIQNSPPTFTSEPSYTLAGPSLYRYEAKVSDPDDDEPLRFSLIEGPPGMDVDLVSGVLTWDVPLDATGEVAVELAVSDPWGGETRQRYTLDIAWETQKPAPAPTASTPTPASADDLADSDEDEEVVDDLDEADESEDVDEGDLDELEEQSPSDESAGNSAAFGDFNEEAGETPPESP